MKAAIRSKYGTSQVLSIKEIAIPSPKENELLIRVCATTVNRTDCGVLSGKPYIVRIFTGLFKPRSTITGSDFAGQVEAVGERVQSFKAGDRLMGFTGMRGCGSHAQYLAIPETKAVVTIPPVLGYEEAAACLEGAFYALNIINSVNPKAGQKAIVNGATGAIGSSMVQFLKFFGVYVTAVCSTEHFHLLKSLGADKVIDYKTDDFTKDSERYDYVFDAVGKSSFSACKPLLKEKGIYTSSDGVLNLFLALVTPAFGGKKVRFAIPKNLKAGLSFIKGVIEEGGFRAVIDRKYPLDKITEAYDYVATGQKTGNVIMTMNA